MSDQDLPVAFSRQLHAVQLSTLDWHPVSEEHHTNIVLAVRNDEVWWPSYFGLNDEEYGWPQEFGDNEMRWRSGGEITLGRPIEFVPNEAAQMSDELNALREYI